MVYKWYSIYCQLGDGLCHRSHLLGEPETTIDICWFHSISMDQNRIEKNPSGGGSHGCNYFPWGLSRDIEALFGHYSTAYTMTFP